MERKTTLSLNSYIFPSAFLREECTIRIPFNISFTLLDVSLYRELKAFKTVQIYHRHDIYVLKDNHQDVSGTRAMFVDTTVCCKTTRAKMLYRLFQCHMQLYQQTLSTFHWSLL